MKNFFIAVGILGLFTACTAEEKYKEVVSNENTPKSEVVTVVPNKMLTMEIDGMVCKMGCGGSIRKALLETGGVSQCEFDFEENRKTNIAKISFNKDLVSADELVNVVSTINDNQFTVGAVSTLSLEDLPSTEKVNEENEMNATSESAMSVSSSSNGFEMPNLLKFVSELLIH